ncbi:MAG: EthD family reductase [Alphaproteobacteria bacterium]
MHKLVVLYKTPKDPVHFKHYYETTHLPLARKMPNVKASRHSFAIQGMGGPAPYFCVYEAEFESEAAMGAAFGSPEGQAVVADVPNYATAEVTIMHYEVAK